MKYRYLFFITCYLEEFYSTDNQQLQNIFNFIDHEVNEVKGIYEEYSNRAKYNNEG
jgi:hypothetical protein